MVRRNFSMDMLVFRWSCFLYCRFVWWAIRRKQSLHYSVEHHRHRFELFRGEDFCREFERHDRIEDLFDLLMLEFYFRLLRLLFDRMDSVHGEFFSIARREYLIQYSYETVVVVLTGRFEHRSMKQTSKALDNLSRYIEWLFVRSN